MNTDKHKFEELILSVFICVHLWFHSFFNYSVTVCSAQN